MLEGYWTMASGGEGTREVTMPERWHQRELEMEGIKEFREGRGSGVVRERLSEDKEMAGEKRNEKEKKKRGTKGGSEVDQPPAESRYNFRRRENRSPEGTAKEWRKRTEEKINEDKKIGERRKRTSRLVIGTEQLIVLPREEHSRPAISI